MKNYPQKPVILLRKLSKTLLLIISAVIIFSQALNGASFALRTLKIGDSVKDYELKPLKGDIPQTISEFTGENGLIIIFWATWSERSQNLLKFAETTLKQQYADKGINFIGINIEGEAVSDGDMANISSAVKEIGISFPIAIDQGLIIFDEIGVITNPTTVLVSKSLILEGTFPGFPSIARDEIPKMVNDYLGIEEEKPPIRVQYLLDHKPKNKALLRYNLGRNIYKRYLSLKGELKRVPAGAVKQLNTASERDPDFYAPYLLKTVIYHKTQEEEKKKVTLDQIQEKEFEEHLERIDLAYMYILIGMNDKAEVILSGLTAEIPDEPEVKLLKAVILLSGNREEDARAILAELVAQEKSKKVFSFDLTDFVHEDTGEIREDPQKAPFLIAEKVLNISKK